MRHALIKSTIATLLITIFISSPAAAYSQENKRPNIVIIMADDMGYSDIGCYGGEIRTPNLNKLANGGLRFTQFYNTARCCPTRASLLTGLYPHQAGMGWMTPDLGYEGYQGQLNQSCITIAELLRMFGYSTYMSGKWHLTRNGNMDEAGPSWPRQRGFDRFFGTITGAGSFYTPSTLTLDNKRIEAPKKGFYYTDAISDYAVKFATEHKEKTGDQPFFMYVSYTAPHWPLHALQEDIDRYDGVYDKGWDALREERYTRMQNMGLLKKEWKLSPRDPDSIPWKEVPEKRKKEMALKMQIYAAQIDRMDQGIGKIIAALEKNGQLDNTLVLFLADNGGCAEGGLYGFERMMGGILGTNGSFASYGLGWANASNTPFRLFKHWVHEGGVSTPLIAYWPRRLPRRRHGQLEWQPGHLIDLMATCADVSEAKYPKTYKGHKIRPMEGVSLMPAIDGNPLKREAIYWEHEGNRAVRMGDWKLVAKGKNGLWELYNMKTDRSETNNLALKDQKRVAVMSAMWTKYAARANVFPLDPRQKKNKKTTKRSSATSFKLERGDQLKDAGAPSVKGKAFSLSVEIGPEITDGVLVSQGGVNHGYSLFVEKKHLKFSIRRSGQLKTVTAKHELTSGKKITVSAALAKNGSVTLRLGDNDIGSGNVGGPLTGEPILGLRVGSELGDPVGPYKTPFAFGGNIGAVELRIGATKK